MIIANGMSFHIPPSVTAILGFCIVRDIIIKGNLRSMRLV
jgi:hypothetical protein